MLIRSLAAAALVVTAPLSAQGLTSMLGGGLPGLGSAPVGNVVGLLGYCVKNKLTGGAMAQGVLGKLTGQPAVTNAPGYAQGQLGQVLGGNGQSSGVSLDSMKGKLKTKACDLVLKRAGSFM